MKKIAINAKKIAIKMGEIQQKSKNEIKMQ